MIYITNTNGLMRSVDIWIYVNLTNHGANLESVDDILIAILDLILDIC